MSEESNPLIGNVVFVVLTILFFALMLFIVVRLGTTDAAYEQIYAKRIALMIDSAKAPTTIAMDITELYKRGAKNKFGPYITIKDNNVIVQLIKEGGGYSYQYFSTNKIDSSLNSQTRDLLLKIT